MRNYDLWDDGKSSVILREIITAKELKPILMPGYHLDSQKCIHVHYVIHKAWNKKGRVSVAFSYDPDFENSIAAINEEHLTKFVKSRWPKISKFSQCYFDESALKVYPQKIKKGKNVGPHFR